MAVRLRSLPTLPLACLLALSTGCLEVEKPLKVAPDGGLVLDDDRVLRADFGTGHNEIARGDHSHDGGAGGVSLGEGFDQAARGSHSHPWWALEDPDDAASCQAGQLIRRNSFDDGWECADAAGGGGDTGALETRVEALERALDAAELELAALRARLDAPGGGACPSGYAAFVDANDPGGEAAPLWRLCRREIDAGVFDELVGIGGGFMDRYELSLCGGELGEATGQDTTAIGCSVAGAQPEANLSQTQALAACTNAGKRLCRNAEWQAAVAGTPDPGAWPDAEAADGCIGPASDTACSTCAGSVGASGAAVDCRSRSGAYDLIGNVSEWVADWALDGGAPRGWRRGGHISSGTLAGSFALDASGAPSLTQPLAGARCCVGP